MVLLDVTKVNLESFKGSVYSYFTPGSMDGFPFLWCWMVTGR